MSSWACYFFHTDQAGTRDLHQGWDQWDVLWSLWRTREQQRSLSDEAWWCLPSTKRYHRLVNHLHGGDEARHSQNSESNRSFSLDIDRQTSSCIDRLSLTNIDRPTLTGIYRHQSTTLTSDAAATELSHQRRDRSVSRRNLLCIGNCRREAWWEMWWHIFPNGS